MPRPAPTKPDYAKRLTARFALLLLLFRALLPAGIMPAPLANGWPLQFCPDGLRPGVLAALSGHRGHLQHHGQQPLNGSDSTPDQIEHCPFGMLSIGTFLPGLTWVLAAMGEMQHLVLPLKRSILERQIRPYHSQAPPGTSAVAHNNWH